MQTTDEWLFNCGAARQDKAAVEVDTVLHSKTNIYLIDTPYEKNWLTVDNVFLI
jgi:hypothetical protein